jgi:hypothetical protein
MDPWTKIPADPRCTNGHGWATLSLKKASGYSRLSFLPWEHLEDEGILTMALVGAGASQFGRATMDRGGSQSFSMGQCLEHGKRELGVGLDAVKRWGALGCYI